MGRKRWESTTMEVDDDGDRGRRRSRTMEIEDDRSMGDGRVESIRRECRCPRVVSDKGSRCQEVVTSWPRLVNRLMLTMIESRSG